MSFSEVLKEIVGKVDGAVSAYDNKLGRHAY